LPQVCWIQRFIVHLIVFASFGLTKVYSQ
jgi:hypothetical protein